MVEFIRGDNFHHFCRIFRVGSIVHVPQRHAYSHGMFMEVSEYGAGGLCSVIIIPEGREGSWWSSCVVHMRKVVHYFE